MPLNITPFTAAAILLALAGTAQAQTLVGASSTVNGRSTLFVLDPATGASTPFMTIPVPANYDLRTLAAIPGCKLAGMFYRGDTANNPSQLVIIDPAAGTYTVNTFGAPLATSYEEGMDWSPRNNALLVSFGPFGNFGTTRLALVNTAGTVLATSNALALGDIDTIASSATLDLLLDLNRTTTPRVYNLSTPFPNPAITAFASPPSMTGWYDSTIHPTTGEVVFSNETGGRLRYLVGNTYVDGAVVQTYLLRGLTWCTLPPVNVSVPSDVIVCPGGTATITVTHLGTGPFTYQWRVNDSPINPLDNASAATSSLVITNADLEDVGDYTCVISGPCASVTTGVSSLRVCAGDFNCDGFVNGDDYDAFASLFESGDLGGDFNDDGFVNGDDYDAFASAFENGC